MTPFHTKPFLNSIFFSVNQYMDGDSEEGVINVDVNRAIGCHCKLEDHFWVKSLKEQPLSSITTGLIV